MPFLEKIKTVLKRIFRVKEYELIDPDKFIIEEKQRPFFETARDLQEAHLYDQKEAMDQARMLIEYKETKEEFIEKGFDVKTADKYALRISGLTKAEITDFDLDIIEAHYP